MPTTTNKRVKGLCEAAGMEEAACSLDAILKRALCQQESVKDPTLLLQVTLEEVREMRSSLCFLLRLADAASRWRVAKETYQQQQIFCGVLNNTPPSRLAEARQQYVAAEHDLCQILKEIEQNNIALHAHSLS